MPSSKKPTRTVNGSLPRKKKSASVISRYRAEAKEIATARQAMERAHRGIEFEPERLHYVTVSQMR
jgi:hypothetical protein